MPSVIRSTIPSAVCAVLLLTLGLPTWAQGHTVPLEIVHGKPYVTVMVNGRGPFRFVVDTGTGAQALVTPELASELGLPTVSEVRLMDPSGQGAQRTPVVLVESLRVADVEFTGVSALLHDLPREDAACQGMLGFTLFRNYLLTLDYPAKQMTLAMGSLVPDGEFNVLPMRVQNGVPVFTLHLNGVQVDAELDSGGIGLSLPEPVAARLHFDVDPELFANSESVTTRFQIKAGVLGADVSAGRYTFIHPFVEINPVFPLANFGACPMQNFAITFDQVNLLVRFDARAQRFRLTALPTLVRLLNTPPPGPQRARLIPVG
ncbi:MAG: retropepsin-like aspartic protease [Terracidiphilus sp.]